MKGSKPEKRKPTKINYSEYLAAYNEIVGDRLPHAVEVNSERQRKLKKLIDSLATKTSTDSGHTSKRSWQQPDHSISVITTVTG